MGQPSVLLYCLEFSDFDSPDILSSVYCGVAIDAGPGELLVPKLREHSGFVHALDGIFHDWLAAPDNPALKIAPANRPRLLQTNWALPTFPAKNGGYPAVWATLSVGRIGEALKREQALALAEHIGARLGRLLEGSLGPVLWRICSPDDHSPVGQAFARKWSCGITPEILDWIGAETERALLERSAQPPHNGETAPTPRL
jgi:hypothetical protein